MSSLRVAGSCRVLTIGAGCRLPATLPREGGLPTLVLAGFVGVPLPDPLTDPTLERLHDGRLRLAAKEGEFEFAAREASLFDHRPALFDPLARPYALRPRDRGIVRLLLALLRLPGGAGLLRRWHARRG